ncbi:MAG: sensor histidine kinase [Cytophagales bacterium]|nr:MAG: sensor histidine kinase [Cytophagales bacterium]
MAEHRKKEDELNKYAKQQDILLRVSTLFNTIDDFIHQLSEVLSVVGDGLAADRVYIFEDSGEVGNLVCEWRSNQVYVHDYFTNISYKAIQSWKVLLSEQGNITAQSTQALPEDISQLVERQGIKSMLILPICIREKAIGFLGLDNHQQHIIWDNIDLHFLKVVSNLISHAFDRHYSAKELTLTLENQHRINHELVRQNNDLQQFTYIVSHNLRAPIANLLGLVSLYRPQEPMHEVNKMSMENIKIVSYQLDSIVRDLNEIVEIKQHLIAEIKENIYLEEEMREILNSLERQIYVTQAQLEFDFTKVSHIFTIRKYLNSILLHLLSNALKYKHPNRNPIISLSNEILDDFICLTIKDNGLGIDLQKNAKKIFGFHRRFHSHVGGRGIGLYLVKLQTEALGGWIEVESQPEQGSVFKVYLPK